MAGVKSSQRPTPCHLLRAAAAQHAVAGGALAKSATRGSGVPADFSNKKSGSVRKISLAYLIIAASAIGIGMQENSGGITDSSQKPWCFFSRRFRLVCPRFRYFQF